MGALTSISIGKNCFYVVKRIRQGDVSVSENPAREMQVNCLLYKPLRDLAKKEEKGEKIIIFQITLHSKHI